MKTQSIISVARLALVTLLAATAATVAGAQATRTWVSGVGDDANPCSRTAPCKTFAGAISKTAAAGEINVLDPGGFGAVTITKSITIDGSGGSIAGVLVSGTNGIIISAGATDTVTLRNLDIDGIGTGANGIKIISAGKVKLENLKIYGFSGTAVTPAAPAVPTAGSAGVLVEMSAMAASTTLSVMMERCTVDNNLIGVFVTGDPAVNTKVATLRLSDSTVTHNLWGIVTGSGGSVVSYNNNRLAGNGTDGAPTQTIYLR